METLTDLPWNEFTKDNFNLKHAQKQLDKDHYGLEKVKDRILEHLAVLKLRGDLKVSDYMPFTDLRVSEKHLWESQ